jgi:DNA-binding transcriptional ArsR family regulator
LKPSFVPTIAVSVGGSSARAVEPDMASAAATRIRIGRRLIDHTLAIGEAASQLLSQGENPIIRYRFSADPAESIAFSYSPVLEAALSLHVLSEPKHHPLQHPWVRRARLLPPALRREITAFRFAYDGFVPEFLMPSPASPYRTFEEDLRELEQLDDSTLALGFLRPQYDHRGERDETLLADPGVREHVVARAGALGGDPGLAALIFDAPRELAERFAALLASYWEVAFEEEWRALEPGLAETVAEAGRRIAGDGVYGYLTGLSPQLLIDPGQREIRRDLPHEHTVEVGPRSELVLVPSVFVWPHVRLNCDPPWPPAIVYPAPFALAGGRARLPSEDVVHVLRALADETRLRALKLIAAGERSTQELAPLIGISEAGLSKHLRLLARAGLVRSRREGYYVLYSLESERISTLSEAVLSFLQETA